MARNKPTDTEKTNLNDGKQELYELSIVVKVTWQAHSLSNAGSNGSIRTMPRRQLLADGTETDACSGNIAKYHHAELLIEYLSAAGIPICKACRVHDGRRAFALVKEKPTMQSIITDCGICDAHGFLIPPKNESDGAGNVAVRERISKSTLIDFSMALAIPGAFAETTQIQTRSGDGQMLMKVPARSGEYALCLRYKAVGVGVDTERWDLIVREKEQRQKRHRAILQALRDQMLSPDGALTARMLPHLTGLKGMILVRASPGRAPLYSALEADYMDRLKSLSIPDCTAYQFENINEFCDHMNYLIQNTTPSIPCFAQLEKHNL